jgi:hypothetical protein
LRRHETDPQVLKDKAESIRMILMRLPMRLTRTT